MFKAAFRSGRRGRYLVVAIAVALIVGACSPSGHTGATSAPTRAGIPPSDPTTGGSPGSSTAPTSPPVNWCETGFHDPFTSPPAGAISVAPGDNSGVTFNRPNTVYWFATGTHTLGTGPYDQIQVGPNDTYVGAPGAVLSGQDHNDYAFVGSQTDAASTGNVIIEYLTIENFTAGEGASVVGQGGEDHWSIQHNLVADNPNGAGVQLGSNSTVSNNCLTRNGEYGFNAFESSNVTLTNNEVSFNDTNGEYDNPSGPNPNCGCAGAGKFWATDGGLVAGNYVHDNYDPGLWLDTNNRGFLVEDNYIAKNFAEGMIVEISYNVEILDNTFVGNDIGAGEANKSPDFPASSLYISESGGDARIASDYAGKFQISGNVFTNNWGGVTLYENANRFCSDGSDGVCTLVDPSVYSVKACGAHLPDSRPGQQPDYYDNCRWKTMNVRVSNNVFNFNPSAVGSKCTPSSPTFCGYNGLFSGYGSLAPYRGWKVPLAISNDQNNVFADNTYHGPWMFDAFSQGEKVTWSNWTKGFDAGLGSGDHFNPQDAGSVHAN